MVILVRSAGEGRHSTRKAEALSHALSEVMLRLYPRLFAVS